MKVSKLIMANAKMDWYEDAMQEALRKIPIIESKTKKNEKVSLEMLEKLFNKLCKKYNIKMQGIYYTELPDEEETPWYSLSLKEMTEHKWIDTIYGLSLYEVYCKATLYVYAYTRKRV